MENSLEGEKSLGDVAVEKYLGERRYWADYSDYSESEASASPSMKRRSRGRRPKGNGSNASAKLANGNGNAASAMLASVSGSGSAVPVRDAMKASVESMRKLLNFMIQHRDELRAQAEALEVDVGVMDELSQLEKDIAAMSMRLAAGAS